MSDTLNLANSIWPNGMKVDSDGYAVFYPLGTKKVQVPTSSSEWPKGNKLVSPYVYQDDKLVGFVDTKALTVSDNTTIYLPYKHIEAEFSAIEKGKLQIHAPKATTKKASWKDSGVESIPEVQYKYKNCYSKQEMLEVNSNYLADIKNGTWSEPLWDLEQCYQTFANCANLTAFKSDLPRLFDGTRMFRNCTLLKTFNSNLSSLEKGQEMFAFCYELTAFDCDLNSLTDGENMFENCKKMSTFNNNLSSLTNGSVMFANCWGLSTFTSDLSKLENGYNMFYYCNKLTSFSADLSSLTHGLQMFYRCNELTSFTSVLPSLTNGSHMFYDCSALTAFSSDLSSLTNGNHMFDSCYNLTTFSSVLPSLTNGYCMFASCTKLESFSYDLPKLTDGGGMFSYCYNLTALSSDLSSLTDGRAMFKCCTNLTSFKSNLSSLTGGVGMFSECSKLESFNGDLSSLNNSSYMFSECSKLKSFKSDLSNLTDAFNMFYGCILDSQSVQQIADTIRTPSFKKEITIGIGNSTPNEQEEEAFNKMVSKNWIVYVGVNGTGNSSQWNPTSLTPIDGEEITNPIPFWAKPVQSDEEHAQYVDTEGNFFNILGGNFIYGDDLSTYGMFVSLEDAAANMRLTPYVKPQTEIENQ